jgi:hypothetical protein
MKKFNIIFWTTTSIIFLFEGVLSALTMRSPMAIEGITHLGYPVYFVTLIGVFKVFGTLALIIPQVPARVKEWAYAGFGIDFLSAAISIAVVDGVGAGIILPILFIGILIASYVSYHKLINENATK